MLYYSLSNVLLSFTDNTDGTCIEICAARLPGAVHVLRVCECLAERFPDAVGNHIVDGAEHEQRV